MATASETMPRRPWTWGLGHHYISLFLSVIFLDRLAPSTLDVGGLGPSIVGAGIGGLLAFGLLFYAAAMRGVEARVSLPEVLAASFGERGARWLPGLLLGLANIVWLAVVLDVAANYGARGLTALGVVGPNDMADWTIAGLRIKAPVILVETLAWGLFAAFMATRLVRVVAAVNFTYPIFPGLALAFAFFYTLPGIGAATTVPRTMPEPGIDARIMALLTMVQLVCGFFATSGLMGADWGKASREARDVRLGGLIGIALASTVFATLSLSIVANTVGPRSGAAAPAPTPTEEPPPNTAEARLAKLLGQGVRAGPAPAHSTTADGTLGSALEVGLGAAAGPVLMVFALGLLGPCTFAPYSAMRHLGALLPKVAPAHLGLATVLLAWPLVAFGLVDRTEVVFSLMGAVFGPLAGVITADVVRHRQDLPSPRSGWDVWAVVAWAMGLVVGLLPYIGRLTGLDLLEAAQPATVLASATAFAIRLVGGRLGRDRLRPAQ
jgi:cytosine/uracil/thiamine/allantoin permease